MEISKEDIECARRLAGEMESNQEQSMFEVKLLLDDSVSELYQDYKLLWDAYPKPLLHLNKNKFANRLRNEVNSKPKKRTIVLNTKNKMWLAVAATILLALFVSRLLTGTDSRYTNHITALKGERTQITLPDHSTVTLNSEAQIKYPEMFGTKSREVWVEGEAYFDITKDVDRPFRVRANGFVIEVLGTKFNVNDKGTITKVSLESGKVKVKLKESGDEIRLEPKEELIWNSETGEVIKRNFDISKTTSWKDNILVLNGLPLQKALADINSFYGVDFSVGDSLVGAKEINGAFENQSLDDFIQTLAFIADVKITPISDNKFSISPSDEN
ncbi:FecR family protein [Zobellia alginiliquefaciens]|uniref:FecR family protein n=1 Tax=Zobellia alginiliquefaciens TaxID=3032586 RepID=UPI0023E448FD|nr:FecR domain-containing protein [Zobellia alginiliquefaciens]